MQRIISTIKTLGYPIAVSAVLLYFCFSTLERNTAALVALDKSISILTVIVVKDSGLKLSDFPTLGNDVTLKQLELK